MQKTFRFLGWSGKKAVAFLCITVVLAVTVVSVTLALIKAMTDPLVIDFEPATLSITKSSDGYGVINDGDIKVYVRVALVFTYKSATDSNNVMSTMPVENVDYTYGIADGWSKAPDGFWYYEEPILPDKTTVINVISSLIKKGESPEGCVLSVEMLIDAIQVDPSRAVIESWDSGVASVDADGNLVLKTQRE